MTTSSFKKTYRSHFTRVSGYPPVTTTDADVTGLTVTGTDTVQHDDRNRRWRDIIRNGGNATTASSGSRTIAVTTVPGQGQLERRPLSFLNPQGYKKETTFGELVQFSVGQFGAYTLDGSVTATNRSLTNLYSQLAAMESTFKGMVFTGEIRESLRMIKSPASALRRGLSDYLGTLKKRVPRRASRSRKRKIISDTWLEYAYGWRPLAADIDDAIKTFYRSRTVRPIFQMIRGFGEEFKQSAGPLTQSAQSGSILGWRVSSLRVEMDFVKHYGIYSSYGNGRSDNHHYGFSPTEFVPTLWELIPYSFLVDYFTNIGDIISSWSYRWIGLNWCARTRYQMVSLETNGGEFYCTAPDPVQFNDSITGHPGWAQAKKDKFIRTPSVALSLPTLEVEVPGMSSTKWINLLALATSLTSARRHING